MAQLTLQVDSPSLFEQLKNVLSLMKGVKIVSDSPISRSAALEDVPNAETKFHGINGGIEFMKEIR